MSYYFLRTIKNKKTGKIYADILKKTINKLPTKVQSDEELISLKIVDEKEAKTFKEIYVKAKYNQ